MKNPYVLACFLLVAPAVLGLTLQEDDLVFDDVGEEGTSTAATVISRRYDERKANWFEQKYPHEIKRHQFDKVNNVPHVVVPVGHVLKLRVHKEAFTGPEDYYEVRKKFFSSLEQLLLASSILFRGERDGVCLLFRLKPVLKHELEMVYSALYRRLSVYRDPFQQGVRLLNGDIKQ